MKKIIIPLVLLLSFVMTPFAYAQQTSIAELEALIARLTAQLSALKQQQTMPPAFCYNFTRDLGIGRSLNAAEAKALDTIFTKERISDAGFNHNEFDEDTAAYVVSFQAKYGIRQTGYVGPLTRAKLNALYGCGSVVPTNRAPVISGVSSPTTLAVGQQGTWTVKAYDPENQSLTYYVVWGDEPIYTMPNAGNVPDTRHYTQTSTFTHTYNRAGVYQPTFYVSDASGAQSKTSVTVKVGNSTQSSTTVTSPNGGEKYKVGDTVAIRWSTTGYSSSARVSIGVYDTRYDTEGGQYPETTIASNLSNTGYYNWVIPSGFRFDSTNSANGYHKIKVYINEGGVPGVNFDESNSPFAITHLTPEPPLPPSPVTFTAPMGGTFNPGTRVNVSWVPSTVNGANSNVVLRLITLTQKVYYSPNTAVWNYGIIPNSGTHEVVIPELVSGEYYFEIVPNENSAVSTGRSANGITISGNALSEVVTGPASGASVGVSVVATTGDKAGAWGKFSADGSPDWLINANMNLSSSKTIRSITFTHNNGHHGYTTASYSALGKPLYPFVVFNGGQQLNTGYDQKMTLPAGSTVLALYAQKEGSDIKGTLRIVFTDGTYVKTEIGGATEPKPTLSVDLKVNGSDTPEVRYNDVMTATWTSTGASYCATSGHYVVKTDGGEWTNMNNAPTQGSVQLYARHQNYGYISPLEMTIQCWDGTNGTPVSDKILVTVKPALETKLSVSPSNVFEDRAGVWNVFGPGKGQGNYSEGVQGDASDWKWTANLTLASSKTIRSMNLVHEGTNQHWSTNTSQYYPLVVFKEGTQVNTAYTSQFGTYGPGEYEFKLYGQIDNIQTSGTKLTIEFTDGTSLSAAVPAYGVPFTRTASAN